MWELLGLWIRLQLLNSLAQVLIKRGETRERAHENLADERGSCRDVQILQRLFGFLCEGDNYFGVGCFFKSRDAIFESDGAEGSDQGAVDGSMKIKQIA